MGILRFLLSLSVVLTHQNLLNYNMVGGTLAVEIFFIISGFYMALILNEKYNSYSLYLTNRLLRIYPQYWIVLILSFLYLWIIGDPIMYGAFVFNNPILNTLNELQHLIENITLFITINSFFYIPHVYNALYVSQAWTLVIEVTFYVLAPFFVKGSLRRLIFLFFLSLVIRYYFVNSHHYPPINFPSPFLPYLCFFLTGALSYKLYRIVVKNTSLHWARFVSACLIIVTLFFPIISQTIIGIHKVLFYYGILFSGIPFLLLADKENRISSFLGELSYPIYICHLIVLDVMTRLAVDSRFIIMPWGRTLFALCEIIIVLMCSYVLKRYIGDPINRYRVSRLKLKTRVR